MVTQVADETGFIMAEAPGTCGQPVEVNFPSFVDSAVVFTCFHHVTSRLVVFAMVVANISREATRFIPIAFLH